MHAARMHLLSRPLKIKYANLFRDAVVSTLDVVCDARNYAHANRNRLKERTETVENEYIAARMKTADHREPDWKLWYRQSILDRAFLRMRNCNGPKDCPPTLNHAIQNISHD